MTVYDLFVEFDSGRFLDEGGVEVPAFAAAIEQHQKRITDAILEHARQIYADRSVSSVLRSSSDLLISFD